MAIQKTDFEAVVTDWLTDCCLKIAQSSKTLMEFSKLRYSFLSCIYQFILIVEDPGYLEKDMTFDPKQVYHTHHHM